MNLITKIAFMGIMACMGCNAIWAQASKPFTKGADIGWVTEMEDQGHKFYNSEGNPTDCFALMKQLGMDAIRLRVWVNPDKRYNGTDDVVAKAVRAREAGMDVMLDFHYSDNWADPGSSANRVLGSPILSSRLSAPCIITPSACSKLLKLPA